MTAVWVLAITGCPNNKAIIENIVVVSVTLSLCMVLVRSVILDVEAVELYFCKLNAPPWMVNCQFGLVVKSAPVHV